MKVVIEIPEKTYREIQERNILSYGELFARKLANYIQKGKPLLNKATNKDVLNSIFGKNFSIPLATTEEWLSAPYEGGKR